MLVFKIYLNFGKKFYAYPLSSKLQVLFSAQITKIYSEELE